MLLISTKVNLHFNNESNRFPLEYNEIELTRRYYRSGDSEYRLNKDDIKVNKLQLLLAQANIGQKSFSIINQGTIHQLLHFNKQELEDFFADATGIKAYQIQLKRTERQIQRTKEEKININNILNEMLPRLKLLKREVKKAQQKKQIQEKLRYFKQQHNLHSYKNLKNQLEKLEKQEDSYQKEKNALENKLKIAKKSVDKLTKILSNEKFLNLNKEYQQLLKDRQTEYQKLNNSTVTNIPNLTEKIDNLNKEIKNLKTEKETLKKELSQYKDINIQKYLSSKIDNFISSEKRKNKDIIGFIKESFSCSDKYLLAIESVLGGRLNGLIVEDEITAINIIKTLRKNKLGTLSIYPLNKIRAYKNKHQIKEILNKYPESNLLTDLINYDDNLDELFQYLLSNTILAPNIDLAKEIYEQYAVRLVTLKGDIFEKSGIIKGGYKTFRYLSKNIFKKLEKAQQRFNQINLELNKAETELKYYQSLDKKDDNQNKNSKNSKDKIKTINERLQTIETEVQDFTKDYQKAQSEFNQAQEQINLLNADLNRSESLLNNLTYKKENIIQEKENLKVKDADLELIDEKLEPAVIESKIMRYESRLMSLGDIDPQTEEEFYKVEKRYNELTTNLEELELTAKNLLEISSKLKQKISKKFQKEIQEIDKTFNEYFKTLFKGGSAKLKGQIIDGDIKVDIQPNIPGKKVKTFHLFSGGEKTLISTALILAIVHNQATPFVILDEVDAALDEINSQQLATILKDINEVTQIILVTHNKLIMQIADIMYGVTMHSAGYSDVYSLQL